MHIVFCADRRVLPGLHVAIFSALDRAGPSCLPLEIHLFSDDLTDADIVGIEATLRAAAKPFTLALHAVDPAAFRDFPSLNGSHATYYRLHAASLVEADRFLYLDADTVCDTDVSELLEFDFHGHAAAWTPEAPLALSVDRQVAHELGNPAGEPYFNAGVVLINATEWRRQRVTERAMEYLATHVPRYWDQSALNVVLHRASALLDPRYNTIANHRSNWPHIRHSYGKNNRLIHFVDSPKPWDPGARFLHPQFALWQSVLRKTSFGSLRDWQHSLPPAPAITPAIKAARRKALKDKLLFTAYCGGWPIPIKGIP